LIQVRIGLWCRLLKLFRYVIKVDRKTLFMEPLSEQKTKKELMGILNSRAQYGKVKFVLTTIPVPITSRSMLMMLPKLYNGLPTNRMLVTTLNKF
jgi:hypothetical protein